MGPMDRIKQDVTIVGFWGDHQILPVSDRLARFDLVV